MLSDAVEISESLVIGTIGCMVVPCTVSDVIVASSSFLSLSIKEAVFVCLYKRQDIRMRNTRMIIIIRRSAAKIDKNEKKTSGFCLKLSIKGGVATISVGVVEIVDVGVGVVNDVVEGMRYVVEGMR